MACGNGFAPGTNIKQFARIYDEIENDSGVPFVPPGRAPTPIELKKSLALGVNPNAPPATPLGETLPPAAPLPPATPMDCGDLDAATTVPKSFQLSPNWTLGELSSSAAAGSGVVAQHGLTVGQIVCNLQQLAVNILEPLVSRYGKSAMNINSGFRLAGFGMTPGQTPTASVSQHELGQAADISFPALARSGYYDRANEIVGTLPYNQFILEYSNSVWLHISFGGATRPSSTQVMTRQPGGGTSIYVQGKIVNYA